MCDWTGPEWTDSGCGCEAVRTVVEDGKSTAFRATKLLLLGHRKQVKIKHGRHCIVFCRMSVRSQQTQYFYRWTQWHSRSLCCSRCRPLYCEQCRDKKETVYYVTCILFV